MTQIRRIDKQLMEASINGNLEEVKNLVEPAKWWNRKANVNICDEHMITPLCHAITKKHWQIADYLKIHQSQTLSVSEKDFMRDVADMTAKDLSDLPRSNPDLVQKIAIFAKLKELFEQMSYDKQRRLYKSTKNYLSTETDKLIRTVILKTRQDRGKNDYTT